MSTHDLLDEFVGGIPAPGATPDEHLAHTLACYAHLDDSVTLPGLGAPIGLLRNLAAADVRDTVAALVGGAPHGDADYAVTATWGVYGDDVRTGLTWGDLRALAA